MLDFPNNPTEGDVHIENGQSWTYNNGAWVIGLGKGASQEIVESGLPSAGWQVWGDVLIQWGRVATGGIGNVTIPLIQPFKAGTIPSATSNALSTGAQIVVINTQAHTANELYFRTVNTSNTGTGPYTISWMAIGEAPDDLKKAKVVTGAGGDNPPAPFFAEYHDPTGAASWRIIGTTLECWGELSPAGASNVTITFPKTFAKPPAVTEMNTRGPTYAGVSVAYWDQTLRTTTQIGLRSRSVTSTQNEVGGSLIQWHAIGEWDGVS